MTWRQVATPAASPLTLTQVKDHLRVVHTADDATIQHYTAAAVEWVEAYCDRALMPRDCEVRLRSFPCGTGAIYLPRGPLKALTAVDYIDTDGAAQTLDPSKYDVEPHTVQPMVVPAYGETWPSVREQVGAVTVEYEAGYEDADAVPAVFKQAILLLVGHSYENREAVVTGTIATEVPMTVRTLLRPYRRTRVGT